MTTITATPGGDAAEVELTITPSGDIAQIYRTDANGTHLVRTRPGVLPRPFSPGAETRRNLSLNPSGETGTTNWGSSASALTTMGKFTPMVGTSGDKIFQLVSNGTSYAITMLHSTIPVTGGNWVSCSADVMTELTTANGIRIQLAFNTPTGAVYLPGDRIDAPFYEDRRIAFAVQSPANATSVIVQVQLVADDNATVIPTGTRLWVDAVLIQTGATEAAVSNFEYFDGSTPGAGTLGRQWTGAAHASASIESEGVPFTLDDYEPAAGIVNYVVQTQHASGITRDSVETTFDMDSPWLSVPTLQTLSRPVASVIAYDAMRDTRSTVIDIPGRSDPVVVLRAMGTRRGSLEMFTKTYAESAAIISLCDRGEILMLRQPDHMGMDMYFTALSASIKVLQTNGKESVFSVVLRYVETRFPVGALMSEPGWDFAGLAAENDRFTQIATEYRDFQAVAQHKPDEEA